ncbi:MAG: GDSL-type esterase/lipase family protein [Muribaculaceae bacterium]
MNNPNRPGGVIIILLTAVVIVAALSLVPWGKLTGNMLKDFNLLGDLFPTEHASYETHEELDPELAKLAQEPEVMPDSTASDSVHVAGSTNSGAIPLDSIDENFEAPRSGEVVLIEDYTFDGSGLRRLRAALSQAATRNVRIAVIGDSYIEGDIFTQDVRAALQSQYGGSGVGYMPAYCEFAGFRRSVRQSGSGWHEREIRKMRNHDYRIIAGKYYVGYNGANARFEGTKSPAHVDSWDRTLVQVVAPAHSGTITLTAADGTSTSQAIEASGAVQTVRLDAHTTSVKLSSTVDSLVVLGVYLDANTGVSVDCMSLRGNSGIGHRNLNAEIISQQRQTVDYDLIILEFGINALSSDQSDYSYYAKAMTRAVQAIQSCYPNSVVMLMGIGDRGHKQGGSVVSMHTCPAMVAAQRSVARVTGCLFWDTRAAQGGAGAAIDWHRRGLVNADYIHLNHKGGAEFAKIFINSLNLSLSE